MLFSKQLLYAFQDAILGRVVRVVFGGDLEECREGLRIPVHNGTDFFGDVLVDQQNSNVFAFIGKVMEARLDVRDRRFVIDDQKVFVALFIDVSDSCQQQTRRRVLSNNHPTAQSAKQTSISRTPTLQQPQDVYVPHPQSVLSAFVPLPTWLDVGYRYGYRIQLVDDRLSGSLRFALHVSCLQPMHTRRFPRRGCAYPESDGEIRFRDIDLHVE